MKLFDFKDKDQWLQMRLQDVTSTETPVLFNMSPYQTYFEYWHKKKNQEVVILEDNERLRWGNRLEAPIAYGVAEDQGWGVESFDQYARDDKIRAGSSFDFRVKTEEGQGLLEIKNVDWLQMRDKWVIDGGQVIEAPAHIELQVQHQLMITGYPFCYIAALEGGNRVHLLKRTPQEKIISAIRSKIIKFWNTIENNLEPEPNFERDAEFIAKLHSYAEPGKVMDVPSQRIDELVREYKEASDVAKAAEGRKKAAKAEILTLIGESEKVLGGNYTISCGVVGETEVSFTRKAFRNFRVHFKKPKEKK